MKRFAGKVVIITGSSSGIGQTAALSFAEEGASVLIHGQNKERLEKTEKLLLAEGIPPTRIAKVLGSMEDPKTAELIVAECMLKFGRIDVLINNAGAFSKPGTADPDRMDNLDFLYNVNMRSVVQLTQLAMPHLERAKGNVISVSSCLALRQAMDAYFYGMLKAAMDHWTRGMAQKWGPRGVRFNCINPGPVDTPIFERNGLGGDLKKMHERWVEKTTPLGRYGQTSEMAGPLKFLASDEAAYITGACMSVDGGWAIASVGMDQV